MTSKKVWRSYQRMIQQRKGLLSLMSDGVGVYQLPGTFLVQNQEMFSNPPLATLGSCQSAESMP
ncbi:hypothetical protein [Candidatus Synchoanobacter obligatus]|uniref:Uncharacterized protein n=1 Tax=Candidatus Synchoanobacter obligatus TaxID=2919597 RepID=A0ABT1L5I1_9GAMM|nr:hypothetical protein [Candidatus Synchoanobacter obligatus]MCP8352439.1 hypothetical protein [Candidatus Synchoanobacter obligatus]